MQSPTSFNKPCSPTPPTIPIVQTQTELSYPATFLATWICDQQSIVVQWLRMFSLDSCKLPLPSLPNTKPSSEWKKNNRLDWSHPTRPTIKLQNFPFLPTLLGFVGSGLETNKVYFHTLDTYMSWCEIDSFGAVLKLSFLVSLSVRKLHRAVFQLELVDSIH